MEFCVIAPTCLLEEYARRSKWQMCVAAWGCFNPKSESFNESTTRIKYWEFYKQRVAAGDKVILDNGAYEGQMVDKTLYLKMIEDLKPYAYVVPDVMGNMYKSYKLELDFPVFSYSKRIIVFQGDTQADFVDFMKTARRADIIALPKRLGKKRVDFAKVLDGPYKLPIHALGFIDDDPLTELPELDALGVTSIDSSEPVWQGMGSSKYKFRDQVHVNCIPTSAAHHLVNEKLAEVFRLCGARESTMIMQGGPAQPPNTGIAATLIERGSRYGRFEDQAALTQDLKGVMRGGRNWDFLTANQQEALEMIAHKIARILNGDPNYHDSWHDIEGYARLVADTLVKGEK